MAMIQWPSSAPQRMAFESVLKQLKGLNRIQTFKIQDNPFPVYNVGLREVAVSADVLGSAKLASWRYFATVGLPETVIAADIDPLQPRVMGISYGDKIKEAQQMPAVDPPAELANESYSPLFLRVPGLYVEAYCMKSLVNGQIAWATSFNTLNKDLREKPTVRVGDFGQQLAGLAQAALAAKQPAPRPPRAQ